MSVIRTMSGIPLLRRIGLPLLQRLNFDISIAHHWVPGLRIRLNSFLHKGYWFHRRKREYDSMLLFTKLISPGSTVVEVGGHIGYITAHFASIASPKGKVVVFEPGSNNLPYIRQNTLNMSRNKSLAEVTLVEKAVGPTAGWVEFYEDDLTGQNNSIVKNFPGLQANAKRAFIDTKVRTRNVEMISLDSYLLDINVDFIKIDVEGFELGVLEGMAATLSTQRPMVMVEVQASETEIFRLLQSMGYILISSACLPISSASQLKNNVFCLHEEKHKEQLDRLVSQKAQSC